MSVCHIPILLELHFKGEFSGSARLVEKDLPGTTKLRERAKKETVMSDFQFHKRFVRVEWLAFQKAVDLIREAGWDDSYFVGQLELIGDVGLAVTIADAGRELYDHEGKVVRCEELHAEDLGLQEEIGEFVQKTEYSHDRGYFLKRTYIFHGFRKGERSSYTSVCVAFAKLMEKDDWMLVHECVTDQRLSGNARWVIYRTKDFAEASSNSKLKDVAVS